MGAGRLGAPTARGSKEICCRRESMGGVHVCAGLQEMQRLAVKTVSQAGGQVEVAFGCGGGCGEGGCARVQRHPPTEKRPLLLSILSLSLQLLLQLSPCGPAPSAVLVARREGAVARRDSFLADKGVPLTSPLLLSLLLLLLVARGSELMPSRILTLRSAPSRACSHDTRAAGEGHEQRVKDEITWPVLAKPHLEAVIDCAILV